MNVTHSLIGLHLYDRVVVLCGGQLAYQGPPQHLAHYFRTDDPDGVYDPLAKRTGDEWDASWRKGGAFFEDDATPPNTAEQPPTAPEISTDSLRPLSQFGVLFTRRQRLFVRERSQLGLQAALILGFPCDLNVVEQLRESTGYLVQAFDVGGLVSGLLLFQIILLAPDGF